MAADTVDPVMDEQLAMFVVESHHRSHPSARQAAADGGGAAEAEEEAETTPIINDQVRCMTCGAVGAAKVCYRGECRWLFPVYGRLLPWRIGWEALHSARTEHHS